MREGSWRPRERSLISPRDGVDRVEYIALITRLPFFTEP